MSKLGEKNSFRVSLSFSLFLLLLSPPSLPPSCLYFHSIFPPPLLYCRRTKDNVRTFEYDASGKYLVYVTRQDVQILDASTQAPLQVIHQKGVIDVAFSPKGTYLATWERPGKKGLGERVCDVPG